MGIGNLCRPFYLLIGSRVHTKRDIVSERIIKQNSLLIHVSYKLAKVVYAKVLYVHAIYKHLSLLHIIITRNEIHESGFSRTRLPHKSYGLSLRNNKIDIFQHPMRLTSLEVVVRKRYVTELNLMLE